VILVSLACWVRSGELAFAANITITTNQSKEINCLNLLALELVDQPLALGKATPSDFLYGLILDFFCQRTEVLLPAN
jgi:hypothetical protein